MWLAGVLVTYLILGKPSTAELGLPISILGLKNKIHSLIENKRIDEEKTLQDLANLRYSFDTMRYTWLDALEQLFRIQNNTLINLTKGIEDGSSGHRKVLDSLYGSIKNSQQQLAANQAIIDPFNEWRGGPRNFQLLNDTRTDLGNGLDHLLNALKVLDEVISKAQREKALTESTIGKVVAPAMTLTVSSAVVKILGSKLALDKLASNLLVASNFANQVANQTRSDLKKMMDWKDAETLVNATAVAATKIGNTTAILVQKLNQTIWTAYKPLLKNRLISGANTIDDFLTSLTRDMIAVSASIVPEAQYVFNNTAFSLSTFQLFFEYRILSNSDYLAREVFANDNYYSLAESCFQKNPQVNATLGRAFELIKRCMLNQLDYFSKTIKLIQELFQPIGTTAMAPLADFQTCTSSKLNQRACMRSFATTHMFESSNTTSKRTLKTVINRLIMQTEKLIKKEFEDLENRFDNCVDQYIALATFDEQFRKRVQCFGIEP